MILSNNIMDLEKTEIQALKSFRSSLEYSIGELDNVIETLDDFDNYDQDMACDVIRDLVRDYSSFKDKPFGDRQNDCIVGYLKTLDNLKNRIEKNCIIPSLY